MGHAATLDGERRLEGARPGRILRLLAVRPPEVPAVGWTAALFAVSQANQGLGVNTADTLFFLRFGVEHLPAMILVSGPVVSVALLAHIAGLARIGAARWLPAAFAASAAAVVLERVGIATALPGIYPVVWLTGQVVMTLSIVAMWTAAGEVFTTRQAKRLFPLFASAGIAGGIVGNALTGPLAGLLGTENLLLVQAGLLVGAGGIAAVLGASFFPDFRASPEPMLADLRAGLALTAGSPMLRMAAGVGVALAALLFVVVVPFSEAVAASFPTEAEVATLLGYFSAVATATTFAVSLFVTNRLFARLGVVATLMVVPVVYVGGLALWLVSFGLVTAVLVRGLQFVAVNALQLTAWSSLFNVVSPRRRGQVMAFMTAGPMQLGTTISGALLVAGSALPAAARTAVGLAVALATLYLVARMRTAYTGALVEAVRSGTDVFAGPTAGVQKPELDADVVRAMSACFEDPRPEARTMAVASLRRISDGDAPRIVARALRDEDVRVRAAALDLLVDGRWRDHLPTLLTDPAPELRWRALALIAGDADQAAPQASAALEDPDPSVRALAAVVTGGPRGAEIAGRMLGSGQVDEITAVLQALRLRPDRTGFESRQPTTDAGLEVFLDHPHRRVRTAAASLLGASPGRARAVARLLDDPSLVTRRAAAGALVTCDEGVAELLRVLEVGTVRATDAALRALAAADRGGAALAGWASREITRAAHLRHHRLILERHLAGPPVADCLTCLLAAREERLQRWAILALTTSETEAALRTVTRGIWSEDPETRSQAMEALESLGDRGVVRELLSLLEDDTRDMPADRRASLHELSADLDPWIRALAYRWLRDDVTADAVALADAAAGDSSPLVRTSLAGWRPPIMQEIATLDLIGRVLVLQRVSLFSGIDPEELERVAAVVTERHYDADEWIFHEGEEGDEVLFIVSGEVGIHRTVEGEAALLRRFGPGDHVGELAMLRGRPRSADVLAGPEGVRCLVLTGPQLHAILEERPEVAMAMLATLAERLAST